VSKTVRCLAGNLGRQNKTDLVGLAGIPVWVCAAFP
jgi:hypothetical protein